MRHKDEQYGPNYTIMKYLCTNLTDKHMKYIKTTLILALTAFCTSMANAQSFSLPVDLGITAGSTGIGLEFDAPICNFLGIRGGFDYVPHFEKTLHFSVSVGEDYMDAAAQNQKFQELSSKLNSLTGIEIDRTVDMVGEPSFHNFNIMVDAYPFKNKNWRFTAGVFIGPSVIGRAENATYDAPALVSVNIYNDLYDRVIDSYENFEPLIQLGDGDVYAGESLYNTFKNWGYMGMHIGDYTTETDSSYFMVPDENCMVKATLEVNRVKPYLGFGYKGPISKKSDLYNIAVDCGLLFCGGTPKVVTHEGVDMAHGMTNLNGQVEKYVNISNHFPVYPLVKLTLSRRINLGR